MNELSILELCKQGGWIMIVLAILSIIAIYIFVERFIAIRAAEKDDPLFMDRIRDYLKGANFTADKDEYLPIPFEQMSAANGHYTQNIGGW